MELPDAHPTDGGEARGLAPNAGMTEVPLRPPPPSGSEPCALGLALVVAAGGDHHFLQALRRMAWEGYLTDAAPPAPDEAGMERWWAAQLHPPR